MAKSEKSCLVVLSGGQDSTTVLLWALKHFSRVLTLTFDYGQRHAAELQAAIKIVSMCGINPTDALLLHVPNVLLSRSPLLSEEPLEEYVDHTQMEKVIGDRVELTFVPMRNTFFLTIAANVALAHDCFDIATGVCAMDNANYPDCTEQFVHWMQHTIRESLGMHRPDYLASGKPQFNIHAPLLHLTKADTIAFGKAMCDNDGAHDIPNPFVGWEDVMAATHTCYAGAVPPCGKCHACVLRAEGFKQAGIEDPLVKYWRLASELAGKDPRFSVGAEDPSSAFPSPEETQARTAAAIQRNADNADAADGEDPLADLKPKTDDMQQFGTPGEEH